MPLERADQRLCLITGLKPDHPVVALNGPDRIWAETNCYTDLWLSVLTALRLDPHACLAYTLAVDFLDDQWTFFKPSHDDLRILYGIDTQEMTLWRPLVEHVLEHSTTCWTSTWSAFRRGTRCAAGGVGAKRTCLA